MLKQPIHVVEIYMSGCGTLHHTPSHLHAPRSWSLGLVSDAGLPGSMYLCPAAFSPATRVVLVMNPVRRRLANQVFVIDRRGLGGGWKVEGLVFPALRGRVDMGRPRRKPSLSPDEPIISNPAFPCTPSL